MRGITPELAAQIEAERKERAAEISRLQTDYATVKAADRAKYAEIVELQAALHAAGEAMMEMEFDNRMLGFLAQIFDEQVDGQMTGYDAARQIVRCLDADGYRIVAKETHIPEIPE